VYIATDADENSSKNSKESCIQYILARKQQNCRFIFLGPQTFLPVDVQINLPMFPDYLLCQTLWTKHNIKKDFMKYIECDEQGKNRNE